MSFTIRMADETEDILRRVAAGELTPEQALPLLDAAKGSQGDPAASGVGAPGWGAPPGPAARRPRGGEPVSASDRPRVVRVAASYRSIELVADPSVDGA